MIQNMLDDGRHTRAGSNISIMSRDLRRCRARAHAGAGVLTGTWVWSKAHISWPDD